MDIFLQGEAMKGRFAMELNKLKKDHIKENLDHLHGMVIQSLILMKIPLKKPNKIFLQESNF